MQSKWIQIKRRYFAARILGLRRAVFRRRALFFGGKRAVASVVTPGNDSALPSRNGVLRNDAPSGGRAIPGRPASRRPTVASSLRRLEERFGKGGERGMDRRECLPDLRPGALAFDLAAMFFAFQNALL